MNALPSHEQPEVHALPTSRRRLFTFVGLAGAAVAGTQISGSGRASAADGDSLVLGHDNQSTQVTHLEANVATTGFFVANVHPIEPGVQANAISAESEHGAGMSTRAMSDWPGLIAYSVAGPAIDASTDTGSAINARGRVAVRISEDEAYALTVDNDGTGDGASGLVVHSRGGGNGIEGYSVDGAGVQGWSENGSGGHFFTTGTAPALTVDGTTQMSSDVDGFGLSLDNASRGAEAGGIYATSRGGKPAVEGEAESSPDNAGVGLLGSCGSGEGVTGLSMTGTGVHGVTTGTGIGVRADATSSSGLALRVGGRSAFGTAGSGVVASGSSTGVVDDTRVTADSHVSVTLTSDPGSRQLVWVERNPGVGLSVHLSTASPKQRPRTTFTYLITEPAEE